MFDSVTYASATATITLHLEDVRATLASLERQFQRGPKHHRRPGWWHDLPQRRGPKPRCPRHPRTMSRVPAGERRTQSRGRRHRNEI